MVMKPPPPGPATNGSVTPRVLAAATAASMALPPVFRTWMPALLALNSELDTAPPVPVATGSLTYWAGWALATAGALNATRAQPARATNGRARMEHPRMGDR